MSDLEHCTPGACAILFGTTIKDVMVYLGDKRSKLEKQYQADPKRFECLMIGVAHKINEAAIELSRLQLDHVRDNPF